MEREDSPLLGISLLLVATVLFAGQDVFTKFLTTQVSVTQILVVRFAAFALFAVIYAHRRVGVSKAFQSSKRKTQTMRCLIMCTEIGIFAYAVRFWALQKSTPFSPASLWSLRLCPFLCWESRSAGVAGWQLL